MLSRGKYVKNSLNQIYAASRYGCTGLVLEEGNSAMFVRRKSKFRENQSIKEVEWRNFCLFPGGYFVGETLDLDQSICEAQVMPMTLFLCALQIEAINGRWNL